MSKRKRAKPRPKVLIERMSFWTSPTLRIHRYFPSSHACTYGHNQRKGDWGSHPPPLRTRSALMRTRVTRSTARLFHPITNRRLPWLAEPSSLKLAHPSASTTALCDYQDSLLDVDSSSPKGPYWFIGPWITGSGGPIGSVCPAGNL